MHYGLFCVNRNRLAQHVFTLKNSYCTWTFQYSLFVYKTKLDKSIEINIWIYFSRIQVKNVCTHFHAVYVVNFDVNDKIICCVQHDAIYFVFIHWLVLHEWRPESQHQHQIRLAHYNNSINNYCKSLRNQYNNCQQFGAYRLSHRLHNFFWILTETRNVAFRVLFVVSSHVIATRRIASIHTNISLASFPNNCEKRRKNGKNFNTERNNQTQHRPSSVFRVTRNVLLFIFHWYKGLQKIFFVAIGKNVYQKAANNFYKL